MGGEGEKTDLSSRDREKRPDDGSDVAVRLGVHRQAQLHLQKSARVRLIAMIN